MSYAFGLGIPIKDSVSPDALKNGAPLGTISVGAFSFRNGGATYSVTPGRDGMLIGTKDGQDWKTWQLTAPSSATGATGGALAALQTLTSLNAHKGSTDKSLSPLDVSA